jgi:peptidoglycan/LPS O-acetylase OafA/YrhL
MNKRLEELDSIRGLAAISVVLNHLSLVPASFYLTDKLNNTPLHIFWAGHEAVIMFFILSGFVLSLPYYNNKAPIYRDYIIKRISRIYIPYLVSILFAFLCMIMFSNKVGISDLNKWVSAVWLTTPTGENVIQHVLLLGQFNTALLNPVIWSLVHEMRISIIFPLLMYFILKSNWKRNIKTVLLIPILWLVFYYTSLKLFKIDITVYTSSNASSIFLTPHYIAFFMLGALLARYKKTIELYYQRLFGRLRIILMFIGIMSYTYMWWMPLKNSILHNFIVDDWCIAVGASILIVCSINSTILKYILLFRPIIFMGKISYSLYLSHLIVIFSIVYLFHGKLTIGLILVGSLVVSFIVAAAMYYLIEKPSMALGKYLTKPKKAVIPGATKIKTPA